MNFDNYDSWRRGEFLDDYNQYAREKDPDEEYLDSGKDGIKIKSLVHDFEEIIDFLYSKDPIDLGRLDDRLGNIAEALGLSVPTSLPNIERLK